MYLIDFTINLFYDFNNGPLLMVKDFLSIRSNLINLNRFWFGHNGTMQNRFLKLDTFLICLSYGIPKVDISAGANRFW